MATRKTTRQRKTEPSTYPTPPSGVGRVRETAGVYTPHTVGVRELRQNLSVYLDEVKRGQALWVTEHGQEVALLRPVPKNLSALDRLVLEGKATAPTRSFKDLKPLPKPKPLAKGEKTVSQILQEMRDEEYS